MGESRAEYRSASPSSLFSKARHPPHAAATFRTVSSRGRIRAPGIRRAKSATRLRRLAISLNHAPLRGLSSVRGLTGPHREAETLISLNHASSLTTNALGHAAPRVHAFSAKTLYSSHFENIPICREKATGGDLKPSEEV
jgi:hypothetical protein